MEAKDFQSLVEQLGELTAGQREALVEAIKRKSSVNDAIALIETRFAAAPRCGHCRSERVATWAKPNPLTRYKCKACGKTFNALTGTPLAHLQRRDAWLKYAQALADGVSLRKAAKRCRIALDTAFRWRHRFLKTAKDKKATSVAGIVEADETYFLKSQKGARKVKGRAPRKRGRGEKNCEARSADGTSARRRRDSPDPGRERTVSYQLASVFQSERHAIEVSACPAGGLLERPRGVARPRGLRGS